MSTTSLTPSQPIDPAPHMWGADTTHLPTSEARSVPFIRLVRLELRKLTNTRAGRGVIIAILLVTLLAISITLWAGRQDGIGLTPLLVAANMPQALLLPVLGVMTAANEWSQRTALITFTQEPRRLRVMTAKIAAVALLGLGVLTATVLLAVGAHVLSMTLAGEGEVNLTLTAAFLVNLVVLQVQGVLLGLAIGALFLNVPFGIVSIFLIPVISSLVFSMTARLNERSAWLDLGQSGAPLQGEDWLTATEWAQFATANAIWLLLPLAIGLWRVARREVK